MTANAFISYSHEDTKALDRLHKHLVMLRREGAIADWTDHKILPGDQINSAISTQLNQSTIFIALISPDYLASNYCYEKEFERALELATAGRLRVVPVILEPCDWLASPFRDFLALPKDGNPISNWTNQNNAYLDVITGLRRVLTAPQEVKPSVFPEVSPLSNPNSIRRPRIKQDFDAIQRAEFADRAFGVIREYFQASSNELASIEDLRAKFEVMNPTAFTCSVVNRARVRGGEAHITVHNGKGRSAGLGGDISYVDQRYAASETSNGSICVENDEYQQFLSLNSYGSSDRDKGRLTAEQVAEQLWTTFVGRAGIDYE